MSTLVEVKGLKRYFDVPKGTLHAVDNVDMAFEEGTTMGVVGESGCGKSTLARTIIHLQEPTDGKIYLNGKDVTHVSKRELPKLREQMQIIFQDPYMTLNPRYTVEDTLKEPLVHSGRYDKGSLDKEIRRLMDMVGISGRLRMAYPHELSGGRRQRVGIGRALAMNPKFIACDEPVSALDVSIQAQILNLLQDLQKEYGLTYMFVTHDMSVVKHISHKISVMYLGQVVETGTTDDLFDNPLHPYTKALLSAIPTIDIDKPKNRIQLHGELMSPINPKPGCRFAPRCPYATEACSQPMSLREVTPGHLVSCCRAEELSDKQPVTAGGAAECQS
ncbi:MAG: ATP-binding cassette domain-containing protein [Clostridiales bacterium]|nr:ATP-binding cassette domain-containing protein [Clostridiales bacterium]